MGVIRPKRVWVKLKYKKDTARFLWERKRAVGSTSELAFSICPKALGGRVLTLGPGTYRRKTKCLPRGDHVPAPTVPIRRIIRCWRGGDVVRPVVTNFSMVFPTGLKPRGPARVRSVGIVFYCVRHT